jgi:hypothetical protein
MVCSGTPLPFTKSNESAVYTNIAISQIISKKSKPSTDGKYVKECTMKAADKCKNFVAYSVSIDERTDVTDIAQLAGFIRGVNEDFQLVVELLEMVLMKGKTGAAEIFF